MLTQTARANRVFIKTLPPPAAEIVAREYGDTSFDTWGAAPLYLAHRVAYAEARGDFHPGASSPVSLGAPIASPAVEWGREQIKAAYPDGYAPLTSDREIDALFDGHTSQRELDQLFDEAVEADKKLFQQRARIAHREAGDYNRHTHDYSIP